MISPEEENMDCAQVQCELNSKSSCEQHYVKGQLRT